MHGGEIEVGWGPPHTSFTHGDFVTIPARPELPDHPHRSTCFTRRCSSSSAGLRIATRSSRLRLIAAAVTSGSNSCLERA